MVELFASDVLKNMKKNDLGISRYYLRIFLKKTHKTLQQRQLFLQPNFEHRTSKYYPRAISAKTRNMF
jgi:hypothetical protein